MIFLDFPQKTCDSTSRSDIFASRRSMIKSLVPRHIYTFQRIEKFEFFFCAIILRCQIQPMNISTMRLNLTKNVQNEWAPQN